MYVQIFFEDRAGNLISDEIKIKSGNAISTLPSCLETFLEGKGNPIHDIASQYTCYRIREDSDRILVDMTSSDALSSILKEDDTLEIGPGIPPYLQMEPKPVQIVTFEDDEETRRIVLKEEDCKRIFEAHEIRDLPLVVISVAGPFRTGKSFLLNLILRYLEFGDDWLSHEQEDVAGFGWQHGVERHTTGIWMWSKVFVRELANGEKVGVALVDTQGSFDNHATMDENTRIFAFNSLICSRQIYNLKEKVGEDSLQQMHLFTKFGAELTKRQGSDKAFQALEFLIRDWEFESHECGRTGGREYIHQVLEINDDKADELKQVREWLNECYESIDCVLLPHPGFEIMKSKFKGNMKALREEFVDQIHSYIPDMFSPSNLIVKTVGGQPVTSLALFNYLKAYTAAMNDESMPIVETVFAATARANISQVQQQCMTFYEANMKEVCGPKKGYITPSTLEARHNEIVEQVIALFNESITFGDKKSQAAALKQLENKMASQLKAYRQYNANKNLLLAMRAPIAFGILALVFNILATFLDVVELDTIASFLGYFTWLSVAALFAHVVLNYTGNQPQVVEHLDSAGGFIWSFGEDMVKQNVLRQPVPAIPKAKKMD